MELLKLDFDALALRPTDSSLNLAINEAVIEVLKSSDISATAYFPYEFNCGDRPEDGVGGHAATDAADIYFLVCSFDDTLAVYKTNLSDMVESVIDGHALGGDPQAGTDDDARPVVNAIAARLEAEAKRLRDFAAIKTE